MIWGIFFAALLVVAFVGYSVGYGVGFGEAREFHRDHAEYERLEAADPNQWGPGCAPQWCQTADIRTATRGDTLVVEQRYVFHAYAESGGPEEWRDVPTVSEKDGTV